ncbi:MAG: UDP-N-acetylglucosamine 2-epimerase (non-hydrolyzing) [Gammaproteobacteria bacterium]|nr:UDP-N-acetylglucosamine 2-epimerase (non-hydrolyzing) [Gammaproteobacteria bacterium]
MLKVMTIVGTRPEIIRLSCIIPKLDRYCNHVLVHTGQNYDYELNEVFFKELGIREPDHFLGVGGQSLGATLGRILAESERVIAQEEPEAVLILGDTNSAISAIIARRMKVPIYHMEAGNRSFDLNVPEETNRRMVDHISDFNLVYTEHARRHLIAEGFAQRRIYLTGSPMREVLDHFRAEIGASDILARLQLRPREYFVISLHREENVDSSARLKSLLLALNTLAETYEMPLVFSTHPRTRKRLEAIGEERLHSGIRFLKPFGFFDYNQLQMNAFCAVSDSGTIAEEASILGFPAVTPRDAIERPEGLDVGCVMMTGLDQETMLDGVRLVTESFAANAAAGVTRPVPVDYSVANTSDRVVNLIMGTARLSNTWAGVRKNDLSTEPAK